MPVSRNSALVGLLAVTTFALVPACTRTESTRIELGTPTAVDRAAAGESTPSLTAGDPAVLPPLPAGTGAGDLAPVYAGSVVTPASWVATSLTPVLSVPQASGQWTFTVRDFSDGTSDFSPYRESSSGNSVQLPLSAGLVQGRVYQWTAESLGSDSVGGSFVVDVQLSGVQEVDSVGGVTVHLSSGEASFAWSSHGMNTLAGQVGFGLRFQASNPPEAGAPAGWVIDTATSSPFRRVEERDDGTVGIVAPNGLVANYRLVGGAYVPVRLTDSSLAAEGQSPVLNRNPDGTWAVTSKHTTTIFRDDTGDGVAHPVDVVSGDNAVLTEVWQGGLIRSVGDPVSGRQITFVYGGGACATPPSSFVAAPADMLCEVRFWDGSISRVFYVNTPAGTVSIGRIVDFAQGGPDALVTDLAYDTAGRIARTRQPLVASAAAAGLINPTDAQFWAEITYDDEGRVVGAVEPAPSAGATRCARTYDYRQLVSTEVTDSCVGRAVMTVEFDPGTFFPLRVTNAHDQTADYTWDLNSGLLMEVRSFEGLVTRNTYDNGLLIESQGPTRGPLSQAQVTSRRYDEDFSRDDFGAPMMGLDVAYWPSATSVTTEALQELGPLVDGSLAPSLLINWPTSPADNDGPWSALMTGAIDITEAGLYTFNVSSDIARLRVNQIPCNDGACTDIPLPQGPVPVQIEISSDTSAASMDITYQGPDTGDQAISVPTDVLRPQYGYATTSEVVDPQVVNAPVTTFSRTLYDNPADGRMSRRVNQSGAITQLRYENGVGGRGGWGRQSEAVQPNGSAYRMQYWGDREAAAAPCPGAQPVNQGGAIKSMTAPAPASGAAPSTTQWYDAAGRVIAMQESGGATTCLTLDSLGRVATLELLGMGQTERMSMNYRVGNNPLIIESTSVRGSTTTTQRTELDLAGRVVRSVDRFGVVIDTTYDVRTDQPASETITVPGSAPSTTTYGFNDQGWVSSVTIDGRVVEQSTYTADGKLATVTYGNGVTGRHEYDEQLRLVAITYTAPNGTTYRNARTISSGGHISGETYQAGGQTSRFDYVHDLAGRLVNASVTAGIVPAAMSWAYTYDTNSNRLTATMTEGGATVGDYTYTYDSADRLVATTDPAASGGLEYDARGNAIRVGANRFTYNAVDRLMVATDGTTTVTYDRDVDGSVIGRTIVDAEGTRTLQFGEGGVILDGDAKGLNQRHQLAADVVWIRPLAPGAAGRWEFVGIDGNLFFTTDEAGVVVGSPQLYEPFGKAITTPAPADEASPNLTWQGATGNETFTLATEVVVMGARVYLPALGRFIQLDPKVGGSSNGYDYAGQNPVNLADPSGEDFMTEWMPMIVASVAAIAISAILPPAGGFMMGAVMGAVMGAATYGLMFVLQYSQDSRTAWSWSQFGQQVGAGALLGGITSKLAAVRKAKALKKAQAAARTASDVAEDGARASLRGPLVDHGADTGSFVRSRSNSVAENLKNPFGSFAESASSAGGGARLSQVMEANFDNAVVVRQSFRSSLISSLDPDGLLPRMSVGRRSSIYR